MKGNSDAVSANDKGECLDNLQKLLLLAVRLELFTIPFYLYTYYSLKYPKSPISLHIREVVMEEMLHMAIISNIMHAIKGCRPPAYSPIKELEAGKLCKDELIKKYVPRYPGHPPIYVPRGEIKVEEDIRNMPTDKAPFVSLDSLTKEQIVSFMRLELPELGGKKDDKDWETISEFYNYVKNQFLSCSKLEFDAQKQIELYTHNPTKGRNALNPICSLKDALDGIDFIVEQGEGATFYNLAKHDQNFQHHKETWGAVEDKEKESELAHFYHFLLIYRAMGGKKEFSIDTLKFVEKEYIDAVNPSEYDLFRKVNVINLVKDPAQALAKGWYPPDAVKANLIFNSNYSSLLDRLTYASVDDHRLNFGIALEQMNKFDDLAREVTRHKLESDPTFYCGPSFEYICPELRL